MCHQCSTFVCGFHGARTAAGHYVCLRCDTDGLGKSSGYIAWLRLQGGQEPADPAESGVALTLMAEAGPECCIVRQPSAPVGDLDEWLAARGDYGAEFAEWLRGPVSNLSHSPAPMAPDGDSVLQALRTFWDRAEQPERALLTAAAMLAWATRQPRTDLNPMIAAAVRLLRFPLPHIEEPRDPDEPPGSMTSARM